MFRYSDVMNWAVSAVLPTPGPPSITTRSGSSEEEEEADEGQSTGAGLAGSGPTVHWEPRLDAPPSVDPDEPFSPLIAAQQ